MQNFMMNCIISFPFQFSNVLTHRSHAAERGNSILIDHLNNVRVGLLSLTDEVLLMSHFLKVTDPYYPRYALHILAENSPVKQDNVE